MVATHLYRIILFDSKASGQILTTQWGEEHCLEDPLVSRNRATDMGKSRVDVGRWGEMTWEIRADVCTLPCVKQIASKKPLV